MSMSRTRAFVDGAWRRRLVRCASSASSQVAEAHRQCLELVRKRDYESYLVSLTVPSSRRRGYIALRAFNVEVASIRDMVKDANMGRMRMVFWKDIIDQIFQGKPPPTPVATALADTVQQVPLSKFWLKRIIDERNSDLESAAYATLEDVEKYSENTASTLLYLSLQLLGVQDMNADHVASHVGKAAGLVTLLRALPLHAKYRKVYLPMDITAKHGVSHESIFRGEVTPELKEAVFEVASAAFVNLSTAQSYVPKMKKSALPPLYSAVPLQVYLERLRQHDMNIFEPSLWTTNRMELAYRIMMANWRQKI